MFIIRDDSHEFPHNDSHHSTVQEVIDQLNFRLSPVHSGECGRSYTVILPDGSETTPHEFFLSHPELCVQP